MLVNRALESFRSRLASCVHPLTFVKSFSQDYLAQKKPFNKERFQLTENLRSAGCSPFIIFKELAVRMGKLITACARKNERTARMLAIACKDHTIPFLAVHYNSLIHLEREILYEFKYGPCVLLAHWISFSSLVLTFSKDAISSWRREVSSRIYSESSGQRWLIGKQS